MNAITITVYPSPDATAYATDKHVLMQDGIAWVKLLVALLHMHFYGAPTIHLIV